MKNQLLTKIVYQDKNSEFEGKSIVCTVIVYYILGVRVARKIFVNPDWMGETEIQIRF